MISLANPQTYRGCENKAGCVAELWARRKNSEHPIFDRSTGQRLHPFDFRALAFERHGFSAKETVGLIKKLARLKASFFEIDPSEETRRWYTVLFFSAGPLRSGDVFGKQDDFIISACTTLWGPRCPLPFYFFLQRLEMT